MRIIVELAAWLPEVAGEDNGGEDASSWVAHTASAVANATRPSNAEAEKAIVNELEAG